MAKKQKSGLYRTAVTVNGQKIWLSARTKAELEQKKRETKDHLINGTTCEDISFFDLVIKWYDEVYAQIGYRPSTYKSARAIINKWILGRINEHQLARAVRRSDLQAIISAMQQECKRIHVSRAVFILSEVCKYGMELGIMSADYAHNLTIRREDAPSVRRPSVSPEDVQRMFDHAGDFLPALAVLYYTGMRRGELTALLWSDVDFPQNVIHVTKTFDMASKTVGPCKTKNSVRDISMPAELVDILLPLRGLPAASVSGYKNDITLETGWINMLDRAGLATHREGKPISHNKENYDLAYTMHQLRHTYATILFAAGVDPVIASRLMGHSSYTVTADIYTDIERSMQQKANEAIQTAFANNLQRSKKNG